MTSLARKTPSLPNPVEGVSYPAIDLTNDVVERVRKPRSATMRELETIAIQIGLRKSTTDPILASYFAQKVKLK